MDINKVLKKQKKSYNRFMLFMGFIFVCLPIILFYFKRFSPFFILYLVVTELLVLQAALIRRNEEYLTFEQVDDNIVIEVGLIKLRYSIIAKKVAIVHTINNKDNFDIIVVTKGRFRNKRLKHVDFKFLQKQHTISRYYNRVRLKNDDPYFYFIIRKGGAKKYLLLNFLYKLCVNSAFTDSAIEIIKKYRT